MEEKTLFNWNGLDLENTLDTYVRTVDRLLYLQEQYYKFKTNELLQKCIDAEKKMRMINKSYHLLKPLMFDIKKSLG
jgi:hypothetical protein